MGAGVDSPASVASFVSAVLRQGIMVLRVNRDRTRTKPASTPDLLIQLDFSLERAGWIRLPNLSWLLPGRVSWLGAFSTRASTSGNAARSCHRPTYLMFPFLNSLHCTFDTGYSATICLRIPWHTWCLPGAHHHC